MVVDLLAATSEGLVAALHIRTRARQDLDPRAGFAGPDDLSGTLAMWLDGPGGVALTNLQSGEGASFDSDSPTRSEYRVWLPLRVASLDDRPVTLHVRWPALGSAHVTTTLSGSELVEAASRAVVLDQAAQAQGTG